MTSLNRREFLILSGATATALAAGPSPAEAAAPEGTPRRPNILVFLTDDHGQWAQRAYGNKELQTPNLDRLAAQGVRMTQAYTPTPVCSPARASFWTGRMPSQHGIQDWLNDNEFPNHPGLTGQTTLPMLLQKAGYHTGFVGKWHCGMDRIPKPGFDSYFGYWVAQYPHRGEQNFSDQGTHVVEQGQQSPLLTNHALDFLQKHRDDPASREKPFFLFVGYVDTHSPHKDAPDDLVAKYQSATFSDIPEERFFPCHGIPLDPPEKDPAREHQKHAEYYGAVSSIDREVGRIVSYLQSSGQLDDTLVVYTGDHGLNCGQHGVWEKGNATLPQNFFDESIKIACTYRWPKGGIRQNVVSDDTINHCDTWRTLLEIAGATPDPQTAAEVNSPGRSYLPQLHGKKSRDWNQTHIGEYGNARVVRTARYKLILRYPYGGVTLPDELYDLQKDPRETTNIHKDPSLAPVVADLTAQAERFFARYTVPGRSGLDLAGQPQCTSASPWLNVVKRQAAVEAAIGSS